MRIVFLATGEIAVPTLNWLISSQHDLTALVTQPDKPVGRSGSTLQPPQVKTIAQSAGIPVLQPHSIKKADAIAAISEFKPHVLLVMAYGQILTRDLLAVPKIAPINLHASLLPQHRGAAPVHAAILAGDKSSGVTVMYVAEGLDTGDILLKKEIPIDPRETAGELHDRIAQITPAALDMALQLLEIGDAPREPQDEAVATYAPKLDRDSGKLNWALPAAELERLIRGLHPWPGTWTTFTDEKNRARRLKIHRAEIPPADDAAEANAASDAPGKVLRADADGIDVLCGQNTVLRLQSAQPDGKRPLEARDLANGNLLRPGMILGSD